MLTSHQTINILKKVISNTPYGVIDLDGQPYFRYDFYSTDMKEAQEIYYNVVEELEKLGIEFDDPEIEHDCITGTLKWIDDAVMVPFSGEPAVAHTIDLPLVNAIVHGTALINSTWMYQIVCVEGTFWCVEREYLLKNRPVYSPYTGRQVQLVPQLGAMKSILAGREDLVQQTDDNQYHENKK